MHKALIQTRDDPVLRSISHCAWDGFSMLGYETEWFTADDFRAGLVDLDADTVVSGFIWVYLEAIKRLGLEPPANFEYPEPLKKYLGREVFQSTLGTVRAQVINPTWKPGFFVKPATLQKAFTGFVTSNIRQMVRTTHLPDDTQVWISDPVEFISEYRFFVLRGELVGVGHYRGDPCVFPDGSVVREAVSGWPGPAAYCIDFGVCEDGRTLLVEVNDGHSMGDYGLYPPLYARLLEARWCELTGKVPSV